MKRFRFSLRTLVCFALLCGSGVALWRNWEPWQIAALLAMEQQSLSRAVISRDGARIAALGDERVFVWNAANGKLWRSYDLESTNEIRSEAIDFSLDGRSLLYTCQPHAMTNSKPVGTIVRIWNVESGAREARFTVSETGSLCFSVDARRILNPAHLWEADIATGKELFTIGLNTRAIIGAFPSPTAEEESKIHAAQNLDEMAAAVRPFLVSSTVSADRRIAATVIMNCNYTQIWNLQDGKRISEIPKGSWYFELSCDGASLTLLDKAQSELSIWNTSTGGVISKFHSTVAGEPSRERYLSPENFILLVSAEYDSIAAIDKRNGEKLWQYPALVEAPCYPILFSDGRRFAHSEISQSGLEFVSIRDATNGREIGRIHGKDEENSPWSWASSPDGLTIAAAYDESCIALWKRHRPEWWWGVAWLPEFWLTLICAAAFGWSVWRECRGARAE